jgi:hypothetical protein
MCRASTGVPRRSDRRQHVAEHLRVAELQQCEVLEIHVAVAQPIELEDASGGALRVDGHPGAVVRALHLAGAGDQDRQRHADAGEGEQARRRGDPRRAQPPPQRHPGHHERDADREDDRPARHGGDEDEAGHERAEDRAGGRQGGEPADHLTGLVEARELELHHHRGDRRQDCRRGEEGHEGQDEDRRHPAALQAGAEEGQQRQGDERERPPEDHRWSEQLSRVDAVRELAAVPAAEGDARQHRADDPGVGLQRHPDVRCEQTSGEDLEDEHRGGGEEHDERSCERRHDEVDQAVGGWEASNQYAQ